MPTLARRSDGCYFIRHFFHDHATWQIVGDGVRVLQNRGVKEGQHFSTDLFMQLWSRRLVYHGGMVPTGAEYRDGAEVTNLRNRVREFYRLIFGGEISAAWRIVRYHDISEAVPDAFVNQVTQFGLTSWKLTDLVVYDLSSEIQSQLGASQFGAAHVRLSQRDVTSSRELPQYWVHSDGQWFLLWTGFNQEKQQ